MNDLNWFYNQEKIEGQGNNGATIGQFSTGWIARDRMIQESSLSPDEKIKEFVLEIENNPIKVKVWNDLLGQLGILRNEAFEEMNDPKVRKFYQLGYYVHEHEEIDTYAKKKLVSLLWNEIMLDFSDVIENPEKLYETFLQATDRNVLIFGKEPKNSIADYFRNIGRGAKRFVANKIIVPILENPRNEKISNYLLGKVFDFKVVENESAQEQTIDNSTKKSSTSGKTGPIILTVIPNSHKPGQVGTFAEMVKGLIQLYFESDVWGSNLPKILRNPETAAKDYLQYYESILKQRGFPAFDDVPDYFKDATAANGNNTAKTWESFIYYAKYAYLIERLRLHNQPSDEVRTWMPIRNLDEMGHYGKMFGFGDFEEVWKVIHESGHTWHDVFPDLSRVENYEQLVKVISEMGKDLIRLDTKYIYSDLEKYGQKFGLLNGKTVAEIMLESKKTPKDLVTDVQNHPNTKTTSEIASTRTGKLHANPGGDFGGGGMSEYELFKQYVLTSVKNGEIKKFGDHLNRGQKFAAQLANDMNFKVQLIDAIVHRQFSGSAAMVRQHSVLLGITDEFLFKMIVARSMFHREYYVLDWFLTLRGTLAPAVSSKVYSGMLIEAVILGDDTAVHQLSKHELTNLHEFYSSNGHRYTTYGAVLLDNGLKSIELRYFLQNVEEFRLMLHPDEAGQWRIIFNENHGNDDKVRSVIETISDKEGLVLLNPEDVFGGELLEKFGRDPHSVVKTGFFDKQSGNITLYYKPQPKTPKGGGGEFPRFNIMRHPDPGGERTGGASRDYAQELQKFSDALINRNRVLIKNGDLASLIYSKPTHLANQKITKDIGTYNSLKDLCTFNRISPEPFYFITMFRMDFESWIVEKGFKPTFENYFQWYYEYIDTKDVNDKITYTAEFYLDFIKFLKGKKILPNKPIENTIFYVLVDPKETEKIEKIVKEGAIKLIRESGFSNSREVLQVNMDLILKHNLKPGATLIRDETTYKQFIAKEGLSIYSHFYNSLTEHSLKVVEFFMVEEMLRNQLSQPTTMEDIARVLNWLIEYRLVNPGKLTYSHIDGHNLRAYLDQKMDEYLRNVKKKASKSGLKTPPNAKLSPDPGGNYLGVSTKTPASMTVAEAEVQLQTIVNILKVTAVNDDLFLIAKNKYKSEINMLAKTLRMNGIASRKNLIDIFGNALATLPLDQSVKAMPKEFGKFFTALCLAEFVRAIYDRRVTMENVVDLFKNPNILKEFGVFSAGAAGTGAVIDVAEFMGQKLFQQYESKAMGELNILLKNMDMKMGLAERRMFLKNQFTILGGTLLSMMVLHPELSAKQMYQMARNNQVGYLVAWTAVRKVMLRGGLTLAAKYLKTALELKKVASTAMKVETGPGAILVYAAEFLILTPVANYTGTKFDNTHIHATMYEPLIKLNAYLHGLPIPKGLQEDICEGKQGKSLGECYSHVALTGLQASLQQLVYRSVTPITQKYIEKQKTLDRTLGRIEHIGAQSDEYPISIVGKDQDIFGYLQNLQALWQSYHQEGEDEIASIREDIDYKDLFSKMILAYENCKDDDDEACGNKASEVTEQRKKARQNLATTVNFQEQEEDWNFWKMSREVGSAKMDFDVDDINEWLSRMLYLKQKFGKIKIADEDRERFEVKQVFLANLESMLMMEALVGTPVMISQNIPRDRNTNGYWNYGYWIDGYSAGEKEKLLGLKLYDSVGRETLTAVNPSVDAERKMSKDQDVLLDLAYYKKCNWDGKGNLVESFVKAGRSFEKYPDYQKRKQELAKINPGNPNSYDWSDTKVRIQLSDELGTKKISPDENSVILRHKYTFNISSQVLDRYANLWTDSCFPQGSGGTW